MSLENRRFYTLEESELVDDEQSMFGYSEISTDYNLEKLDDVHAPNGRKNLKLAAPPSEVRISDCWDDNDASLYTADDETIYTTVTRRANGFIIEGIPELLQQQNNDNPESANWKMLTAAFQNGAKQEQLVGMMSALMTDGSGNSKREPPLDIFEQKVAPKASKKNSSYGGSASGEITLPAVLPASIDQEDALLPPWLSKNSPTPSSTKGKIQLPPWFARENNASDPLVASGAVLLMDKKVPGVARRQSMPRCYKAPRTPERKANPAPVKENPPIITTRRMRISHSYMDSKVAEESRTMPPRQTSMPHTATRTAPFETHRETASIRTARRMCMPRDYFEAETTAAHSTETTTAHTAIMATLRKHGELVSGTMAARRDGPPRPHRTSKVTESKLVAPVDNKNTISNATGRGVGVARRMSMPHSYKASEDTESRVAPKADTRKVSISRGLGLTPRISMPASPRQPKTPRSKVLPPTTDKKGPKNITSRGLGLARRLSMPSSSRPTSTNGVTDAITSRGWGPARQGSMPFSSKTPRVIEERVAPFASEKIDRAKTPRRMSMPEAATFKVNEEEPPNVSSANNSRPACAPIAEDNKCRVALSLEERHRPAKWWQLRHKQKEKRKRAQADAEQFFCASALKPAGLSKPMPPPTSPVVFRNGSNDSSGTLSMDLSGSSLNSNNLGAVLAVLEEGSVGSVVAIAGAVKSSPKLTKQVASGRITNIIEC